MSYPRGQRLGELLIRMKLVHADQLADALGEQANLRATAIKRQFRIGEILVFKRVLTLTQLQAALRAQAGGANNSISGVRSIKAFKKSSASDVDEPSEVARIIKGIRNMFAK
jgi:hypothetical protein